MPAGGLALTSDKNCSPTFLRFDDHAKSFTTKFPSKVPLLHPQQDSLTMNMKSGKPLAANELELRLAFHHSSVPSMNSLWLLENKFRMVLTVDMESDRLGDIFLQGSVLRLARVSETIVGRC